MRTYISLFSSAGVGCYGFKENNFACIATSELLKSRLDIQRYNHKCKYESGYICGDITKEEIKNQIFNEIKLWQEKENLEDVDVIIATPPCQGMSSANYKKNNEQRRNSLVVEAIKIIKEIKPKVFVFENVRAFMKTICTDTDNFDKTIGEAIKENLSSLYNIEYKVINFKDYGVPSSRPRTLVIGTRKDQDYMSPLNLFPLKEAQITLQEAIGDLISLANPNDFAPNDIYHSFREYDSYMREWIHDLKEGESAFDNPIDKKPYKLVNGEKILQKSGHLGNKYRRLYWNKPCACVATRNDQLAAMDTIHPQDDRVLSIRELMRVMSIPDSFKWTNEDVTTIKDKEKRLSFLKKNELNIRRCIGEAVPTKIMFKIAKNINEMLDFADYINNNTKRKSNIYIKSYINENKNTTTEARKSGSFYTPQSVVYDCLKGIDNYNKKELHILEPSVGGGNFIIPIMNKFDQTEVLYLDIVDVNKEVLDDTLRELEKYNFDKNKIIINTYNTDFIDFNFEKNYDYIIGNPPFFKLTALDRKKYKDKIEYECNNIFGLFLEKMYRKSNNIIMVLPKIFIMTPEFDSLRKKYEYYNINTIIDYGVNAFKNVFIEILVIHFTTEKKDTIYIENVRDKEKRIVPQKYIYHDKMWLIYRNEFFDNYIKKFKLDVFEFFRDRQITNKYLKEKGKYWVLRSKNILDDGTIIHIKGYDKYIDDIDQFTVSKYINSKTILMPNFTYNTRATLMPPDVLVNGSIAILIPKNKKLSIDKIDLSIYATDEFREYYAIVKNKSKFTINIDKNSIYYIGAVRCKNGRKTD
ncbi:MAG TPA: DNA (cytosine-5-)-methyltransferase [Candidatus Onthousia faecavium]|nr:DNA (cytosine-5-)-methyltransferase [Candidatus Onthousia faecavium]